MITFLIPCYNEEQVIERTLTSLSSKIATLGESEILVIDDCSTDKTQEILNSLKIKIKNLRIVRHEKNQNLGGALKTGFREAKGEIIVAMDADLTHPIDLIPLMIEPLKNGFDVAFASRYAVGGGMKNVPAWRVALSYCANRFFGIIFITRLGDLTSGFRAYRKGVVNKINLHEKGFAAQLELTVKLIKSKAKIIEIPYTLVNREIGQSKFNLFSAIWKYAYVILKLFIYRW